MQMFEKFKIVESVSDKELQQQTLTSWIEPCAFQKKNDCIDTGNHHWKFEHLENIYWGLNLSWKDRPTVAAEFLGEGAKNLKFHFENCPSHSAVDLSELFTLQVKESLLRNLFCW